MMEFEVLLNTPRVMVLNTHRVYYLTPSHTTFEVRSVTKHPKSAAHHPTGCT